MKRACANARIVVQSKAEVDEMSKQTPQKAAYDIEWKRENTVQIAIRLGKMSSAMVALEKAMAETGLSKAGYATQALKEKLIRDGYLSEE